MTATAIKATDPGFACRDCGAWDDNYMVRGDVWLAAWPDYSGQVALARWETSKRIDPDGSRHAACPVEFKKIVRRETPRFLLCLRCLELRLGRPLEIEDFTPAPVNNAVRFGFLMGRR